MTTATVAAKISLTQSLQNCSSDHHDCSDCNYKEVTMTSYNKRSSEKIRDYHSDCNCEHVIFTADSDSASESLMKRKNLKGTVFPSFFSSVFLPRSSCINCIPFEIIYSGFLPYHSFHSLHESFTNRRPLLMEGGVINPAERGADNVL